MEQTQLGQEQGGIACYRGLDVAGVFAEIHATTHVWWESNTADVYGNFDGHPVKECIVLG